MAQRGQDSALEAENAQLRQQVQQLLSLQAAQPPSEQSTGSESKAAGAATTSTSQFTTPQRSAGQARASAVTTGNETAAMEVSGTPSPRRRRDKRTVRSPPKPNRPPSAGEGQSRSRSTPRANPFDALGDDDDDDDDDLVEETIEFEDSRESPSTRADQQASAGRGF